MKLAATTLLLLFCFLSTSNAKRYDEKAAEEAIVALSSSPRKAFVYDVASIGMTHHTDVRASHRGLQASSFCTIEDIEESLSTDFDFYARAGQNATGVDCGASTEDTCTTQVVNFPDVDSTSFTTTEIMSPCNTCSFRYTAEESCDFVICDGPCFSKNYYRQLGQTIRDEFSQPDSGILQVCNTTKTPKECFEVSCANSLNTCIEEDDDSMMDGGNETLADEDSTNDAVVEICREVSRTDSFSTVETQVVEPGGTRYGCDVDNRKRIFSSRYLQGVTNFVDVVLTLGQEQGEGDVEGRFDTCEIAFDGVLCSSCEVCNEEDFGALQVDCTNILGERATTSCDSEVDGFVFGIEIERKFWLLQPEFSSPTPAPIPAAPTASSVASEFRPTKLTAVVLVASTMIVTLVFS